MCINRLALMVQALATSVFSTNVTPPRRTNFSETKCPTNLFDASGFSRNSGKRTARPNSLTRREIVLKILKRFIRFEGPSMIGHERAAKNETNYLTDLFDCSGVSQNSGKRTARPNSLIQRRTIPKIIKRSIRFREPSVIGRQRSAKAETNCPTHVFEWKLVTSILVKRTARPNLLILHVIILKILKRLIRFREPSMIGRQRSAGVETNWHADLSEPKGLNRDLGKRTGTPKFMKIIEIILKARKIFIHCHPKWRRYRHRDWLRYFGVKGRQMVKIAAINELEPASDSRLEGRVASTVQTESADVLRLTKKPAWGNLYNFV
jgi:hypothetical protein